MIIFSFYYKLLISPIIPRLLSSHSTFSKSLSGGMCLGGLKYIVIPPQPVLLFHVWCVLYVGFTWASPHFNMQCFEWEGACWSPFPLDPQTPLIGSPLQQPHATPSRKEPINSIFIIQMQWCVCIFMTLLSGEYSFVPPHPRCPSQGWAVYHALLSFPKSEQGAGDHYKHVIFH